VASAPAVDPLDPVANSELGGGAAGPQISVINSTFIVAQNDSAAALSHTHQCGPPSEPRTMSLRCSEPTLYGCRATGLRTEKPSDCARLASDEADLMRRVFLARARSQRQSSANKTCSGIRLIKRVTDVRTSDR